MITPQVIIPPCNIKSANLDIGTPITDSIPSDHEMITDPNSSSHLSDIFDRIQKVRNVKASSKPNSTINSATRLSRDLHMSILNQRSPSCSYSYTLSINNGNSST